MSALYALTYVEIDLRTCANTYGAAPCTAAGSEKCFNTRATCQDIANFDGSNTHTLRLGIPTGYNPEEIAYIPLLTDVKISDARVKPGESIGERSTCKVTCANARHGDTAGLDPYRTDRTYNAIERGTFWGKFRARHQFVESRPMRVYRGYLGQSLAEMDCYYFDVEAIQGPDSRGQVIITGVDFMRRLSGDKALAPAANSGYLPSDIGTGVNVVTLEPEGVGDAEYPASGEASLGEEPVTFTRSGDVFTLTRPHPEEHDEGEVLQMGLRFTQQDAASIINTLVTDYTTLDSSYTDLAAWQTLVAEFADVLYSAFIPNPTPVSQLINELIEQAGLVVYGSNRNQQKIIFDVLRPNPIVGAVVNEEAMVKDTFRQKDQPKKRASLIIVWYGQKDPYKSLDDQSNYYSGYVLPDPDNRYDTPAIKVIYSRWLPALARGVAADMAARALARYRTPPRLFTFALWAQNTRDLGEVITLDLPTLEDATGATATATAIVTGVAPAPEGQSYAADEYQFDADLLDNDRTIQFDYNAWVNLRAVYDDIYTTLNPAKPVTFIIPAGVAVRVIDTGDWEGVLVPTIIIRPGGYLTGTGGAGGTAEPGKDGTDALTVTSPIAVDNQGVIGGGGGGGGGGREAIPPYTFYTGGRGAGGTQELGEVKLLGGNGGDLGQPGAYGSSGPITWYPGGAAGRAIVGVSLVTFINAGDIRGAQVG